MVLSCSMTECCLLSNGPGALRTATFLYRATMLAHLDYILVTRRRNVGKTADVNLVDRRIFPSREHVAITGVLWWSHCSDKKTDRPGSTRRRGSILCRIARLCRLSPCISWLRKLRQLTCRVGGGGSTLGVDLPSFNGCGLCCFISNAKIGNKPWTNSNCRPRGTANRRPRMSRIVVNLRLNIHMRRLLLR